MATNFVHRAGRLCRSSRLRHPQTRAVGDNDEELVAFGVPACLLASSPPHGPWRWSGADYVIPQDVIEVILML